MDIDQVLQFVPTFVLVFFRVTGMMIFAPFFGSDRIPRRVRLLIALVLAAGMSGSVKGPAALPESSWQLALSIGGEMAFGIAMGMALSFTFIAAQGAGEIIGQQMGLNLGETFDPQFGKSSSVVGDLYFMLTLIIFLLIDGHRIMIQALQSSFASLPLLSLGVDRDLLHTLISLLTACTTLSLQLAAPLLVTILVVDLALGCIGRAMPQINVMTAGLTVRSLVGMAVTIVGIGLTVIVIDSHLRDSLNFIQLKWLGR
ncbi:MAG TPA: flagellar biosynthetic protein FliR [Tepidisphaeraceae bacterium]|nr:flagellar biosynthetic protein FliR [Tepidisphaeraceae bacterium]